MKTLPLTEGAFVVDNSLLEQLQTCPRLLEYQQIRRRTLSASRPALDFGSAGHLVLEHRYRHYGTDLDPLTLIECEQGQAQVLADFYAAHPQPEDSFRNLNWAMEVFVKHYNERYPIEPFNLLADANDKPMVELSFAIPFAFWDTEEEALVPSVGPSGLDPLPSLVPILYSGKIDLPVLWDESVIIVDHKTTSVLGERFWDDLRVSPQQLGYCWAFWKLTGKMPLGFCVNAIRTSPMPMKPKNGIGAWWEESFSRMKEYINETHLNEWHHNCFALIEEMFWHAGRDYFPMKKKWCVGKYGKCQFYEVCYTPLAQRDELLASSAFEDYTWSPLKKEVVV